MKYVIVGSGVAGMTAALDLARRNVGEIALYTEDKYPYYYRPRLTEFLAGDLTMDTLVRRPLAWYAQRGIHMNLESRVVELQPEAAQIILEDGTVVPYDRLLLAMGSLPFVPPIAGVDKQGLHTWRTLEDTLSLQQEASRRDVASSVVIGGGLLGLEAARGLLGFCSRVTVLEVFPRLLPRQLDEEGAQLLRDFVASLGIDVEVGVYVDEILGDTHVTGVRLRNGRVFPAQLILVSAGVRCNTCFADEVGLEIDRGIVVDEHMATSMPGIYAAGDVAVYRGYNWAIAPIAQAQARIAAANMAGEAMVYEAIVPSTSLKVVGMDVTSVGMVNPEGEGYMQVRELDVEAGTYKKIVLQDGVIVGAIVVGEDKDLAKKLERAIADRHPMTRQEAEVLLS
jgi:nitrite reductase (NADH) large subunit